MRVLLLLLLWCSLYTCSSFHIPRINHGRPNPSSVPYKNETKIGLFRTLRGEGERQLEINDDLGIKDKDKDNSIKKTPLAWLKQLRVSCVMIAIRVVLQLRMERPVLARLPAHILIFLIETCLSTHARPRIVRLVALELDDRVQEQIRQYTGKELYNFGDLTRTGIAKYIEKENYQFGDVAKATLFKFTGKKEYTFGDISKATAQKITGKDDYVFGDITRTVFARLDAGQDEAYQFGDVTRRILKQMENTAYPEELQEELKLLQNMQKKLSTKWSWSWGR